MTNEQHRLADTAAGRSDWQRWGPYVSERAWGTVREDYSASFVKVSGEMLKGESVELTVTEHDDPDGTSAYEELLTDALRGVTARFARQDYVEEAWRIVDPVLDEATPLYPYEPATWGPPEADRVAAEGGWFDPSPHVAQDVALQGAA